MPSDSSLTRNTTLLLKDQRLAFPLSLGDKVEKTLGNLGATRASRPVNFSVVSWSLRQQQTCNANMFSQWK